jgi:hypothetical protein
MLTPNLVIIAKEKFKKKIEVHRKNTKITLKKLTIGLTFSGQSAIIK